MTPVTLTTTDAVDAKKRLWLAGARMVDCPVTVSRFAPVVVTSGPVKYQLLPVVASTVDDAAPLITLISTLLDVDKLSLWYRLCP